MSTYPMVSTEHLTNFGTGQPVTPQQIDVARQATPNSGWSGLSQVAPGVNLHLDGSFARQANLNPNSVWGKIGGMEGVGTIIDGIGSLGKLYTSLQSLGIAREQLDLSKDAYKTNLRNSTKTYNTSLEDRTRARYHAEGRSGQADGYIDKHRL